MLSPVECHCGQVSALQSIIQDGAHGPKMRMSYNAIVRQTSVTLQNIFMHYALQSSRLPVKG